MAALTTTSYAILGLLALRPHTAYELAGQSERSLRFAWPTARSRLYAEPKRLAREGLVEIREQPAGPRRVRQELHITAAGRAALERWMGTPPEPPRIEAEVLLRTLFGSTADPANLLEAIRATRQQVGEEYAAGRTVVDAYLAGDVQYPERLHLNVLWMAFVRELEQLIHDWTLFAEAEVEAMHASGDPAHAERTTEILRSMVGDRRMFPRRPLRPSEGSRSA